jgi:hypothetical protein
MRTLKYTGPLDTLEIYDPKDPAKLIFSEQLHPGRTYELPEGDFQVITNMIGRKLFIAAETATSPVDDTSRDKSAPATVAPSTAEPAGKSKRS